MYIYLRGLLRKVFAFFNLGLDKNKDLVNLHQVFIDYTCILNKLNFYLFFARKLLEKDNVDVNSYENFLVESKSQNGQDLFTLISTDFKKMAFSLNLVHMME